jgi:proline racemase
VIAAATIAVERRLLFSSDHEAETARLVFDTPAGSVQALARLEAHAGQVRVDTVAMTSVPAFVLAAGLPVRTRGRELRVDVAFGGAFYAVVDTEAAGVPLGAAGLPDLRRLGVEICQAIDAAARPAHPVETALGGLAGVIFTGAPDDPEAHLRNVTVSAGGAVDPSPGGTGTAAVIAVLDAMGLLGDGQPFVHEGLTGAVLRGRVVRRTQVGELPAVVTEITGSAWITGESTFLLDDDDPFRTGVGP